MINQCISKLFVSTMKARLVFEAYEGKHYIYKVFNHDDYLMRITYLTGFKNLKTSPILSIALPEGTEEDWTEVSADTFRSVIKIKTEKGCCEIGVEIENEDGYEGDFAYVERDDGFYIEDLKQITGNFRNIDEI